MRPEDALQASVAAYLDVALPSASWWTATANGAFLGGDVKRRAIQSRRMKAAGVKNGTPDILIVWDGRLFAVELKTAKGKLTESQKDASDAIVGAGGGWTVARSIDDVSAFLRAHNVPVRA
ncbi:VRR-NUC domain-containing protein [Sphingomonas albertensis]|uniref:VRR-NUC domain-containing protein n=1 Tax=Sphingomonas albertensis TaxID=2762591 RepID=UPI0037D9E3B3